MAQVECRPAGDSPSMHFDSSSLVGSRPMSRLEQMQANLHRKLMQEKEEKMVQLYNDNQAQAMQKVNLSASRGGGNVRRFFEDRRTMNLDGSMNLENSMTSLDSYFLNASNGVIARNNLNTTMQRPKKGSPLGWDKSYPLVPIERTNSSSSSGYESVGCSGRFATDSGRRVPHVRRQSLDRSRTGSDVASSNMRRSKSQVFEGAARENSASSSKGPTARTRAPPAQLKERRVSRDEEKRKLQQDMRRREQELINKIKEQQAEIERMRQEKIKEEKAQKARLYRKPAPLQRPTEKPSTVAAQSPAPQTTAPQDENVDPEVKPASRSSSGARQPAAPAAGVGKYRPPVVAQKPAATQKPPVHRSTTNSDLPECSNCGRRFAKDRIEKHLSICQKVSTKKRKTFDPVKMRVEGTEQESFLRKGKPAAKPVEAKKANWRQKHDSFLETIRQAKVMQQHLAAGGKLSDLPPPPPMDTSDYVQCPHCQRKFNEGVAERHIPKCKNIRSNKK